MLAMKTLITMLALAGALVSTSADAQTLRTYVKPGQWTVDVTTVTTKAHFNTIGVCVNADGTWYNTVQASGSTPGSGKWLLSGTTVLWRGNMDTGLNDAAVLTVANAKSMSGFLLQWVKDTSDTTNVAIDNVYGTSTWTFASDTCLAKF